MTWPPGPRGIETFGFFGRGSMSGTVGFLEKTARRYGPVSYFRLLHQHIFLIDDAELIREVLITRQHEFERDIGARFLRELVGDSVITREEPLHLARRRILQPAFHHEQIASYAETMARLSSEAARKWAASGEINASVEMRRLTLAIVGACLFGADFSASAGEIASVLGRVFARARVILPILSLLRPVTSAYRKLAPRGPSLFFESERRDLDRIIMPLIERRRRASSKDIVSLLLAMNLTDREVRDELVTFVLAGHETTATALAWASYLLAQHPEVSARMEIEVDEALEDRPMTFEDIPRLRYTAMVFNEAMRLYPPAPLFGRRPMRTLTLGGFVIPKGSSVMMSPWITHRNPRYWERPESFEPERWESASSPKFAFFPFGGGAKMCIGEPFAKLEGVIALAEMARHFRLSLAEAADIRINPGVTLQPSRPIRVVSQRTGREAQPHRRPQTLPQRGARGESVVG